MEKFSKFCSERIHRDTDRGAVCKFRKIWTTGNRWSCALFTWQKNSPRSPALATMRIAPKICNGPGQSPTMFPECSRYHSNRFTFGGVISERVNTVKTCRKVNAIFGWILASSSSRIINEFVTNSNLHRVIHVHAQVLQATGLYIRWLGTHINMWTKTWRLRGQVVRVFVKRSVASSQVPQNEKLLQLTSTAVLSTCMLGSAGLLDTLYCRLSLSPCCNHGLSPKHVTVPGLWRLTGLSSLNRRRSPLPIPCSSTRHASCCRRQRPQCTQRRTYQRREKSNSWLATEHRGALDTSS